MHLRMLWLCLAVSGCLDDPSDDLPIDDTTSVDQALNGDTWSTIDNNPYTAGEGARNYGIAISPTTHTAIVVGSRTETDNSTTWLVRSSANGTSTFVFNTSAKSGPGLNSVATNIAVDPSGTFYIVGTTTNTAGKNFWVVTKSTTDGGSWAPVYVSPPLTAAEVPNGIVADAFGNVLISGMQVQNGYATGVILRGTNHGATWTQVYSEASVGSDGNDIFSLCSARYGGVPALYGVGWGAYSPSGSSANIYHSLDNGATWAFDYGIDTLNYERNKFYGCSATSNTDVLLVGGSDVNTDPQLVSSWTTFVEDVQSRTELTMDRIDTKLTNQQTAYGGVFVASPTPRDYVVGTKAGTTSARTWHVRFAPNTQNSAWLDSDDFKLAAGSTAWANAAAYDSVRGLFVAGAAYDAAGRLHGIVRARQ